MALVLPMPQASSRRELSFQGGTYAGHSVYRIGDNGTADSIDELTGKGLTLVPSHAFFRERGDTPDVDANIWLHYDAHGEQITAFDSDGMLGKRGETYVIDIHGGGIYLKDATRIREDVAAAHRGRNEVLCLQQGEVSLLLQAIGSDDLGTLAKMIGTQPEHMRFAGMYADFLEASKAPDFLPSVRSAYVTARPVSDETQVYRRMFTAIDEARTDPELIIAAGGEAHNNSMLDQLVANGSKRYGPTYGVHDKRNAVRIVSIFPQAEGITFRELPQDGGNFVGVRRA